MFAAAKKGNKFWMAEFFPGWFLSLEKGQKNFFQKRHKKYCGIKKRVLYLHPLKEESP